MLKKKPGAPHFLFLTFAAFFFLLLHHGETEVTTWSVCVCVCVFVCVCVCVCASVCGENKMKKHIYGLLAMLNCC